MWRSTDQGKEVTPGKRPIAWQVLLEAPLSVIQSFGGAFAETKESLEGRVTISHFSIFFTIYSRIQ